MSTIDIDEAIRTYLGSDERGGVVPYGQEERVRAKYGPRATTVLEEVLRVIQADGLLRYHEEYQVLSLEDIAHLVERRARANRPDLQDDVCKAIGSYFAYSYK